MELTGVPGVVELLEQGARLGGVQAHGHVGDVRGIVAAELARGEAVEGHVGHVVVRLIDIHEAAHAPLALEGAEARLTADPVGALGRYGLLRELVAQLDLEVGAAKALLAGKARDVELALLARGALLGERLRREDEAQLVDAFKLLGEFLIGVHGEHRRGYRHAITVGYVGDKVVLDDARPVVEEVGLHGFYALFFASSSIMHVRTKAEKLMPRRAASSFAASRKVLGMRRVTDTWSPFTRKLLISVSSGLLLMSSL